MNLALQGGGAHGAFAWGVLDKLIEDGRIDIEGLSATSAGSMNAVVYAYGKMTGGPDGAREALHNFWQAISRAGEIYSPIKLSPWEMWQGNGNVDHSLSFWLFESMTRLFSPYQFNPFDINPLRDVLENQVDFEQLHQCYCTTMFISATNVRTGKVRVFRNQEVTLDVVMASACLPNLFKAVEIDGDHYWDGGYMGNPALYPFFYHTKTNDVIILHINPLHHEEVPTDPVGIQDRVNEITFNGSLLKELRAVAFVNKLLDEGWLKEEYRSHFKHVLVHSIKADDALRDMSVSSKFNCDWNFLLSMRDKGRATAEAWLDRHYADIGKRSSVDVQSEYLGVPAHVLENIKTQQAIQSPIVADPAGAKTRARVTQDNGVCVLMDD